jgi:cytochrome c6
MTQTRLTEVKGETVNIRTGLTVAAMAAAMTMTGFAQGSGADTYKSKCAMCHGADGMATTPAGKSMKVPAFSDPAVAKMSEAELTTVTKAGKGKMPGYAGKLTDAQINDVVAYVRTLQKK